MRSKGRPFPGARRVLTVLTVLSGGPLYAGDLPPSIGANLALGTDLAFRGVSQTLGGAALQASLGVEFSSGVYGYVWGSNVDFVPDGGVDDGATVEIDTAVGFATNLSDRWAIDGMLVHYAFPGTVDGAESDYVEVVASLRLDDRHGATIAFSGDVFGSGEAGLYYRLASDIRLDANHAVAVGLGHYDLDDAYGASYSHVDLSLRRSFDTLSVTLAMIRTFGDAGVLFPEPSVGTRAVLTVGFDW